MIKTFSQILDEHLEASSSENDQWNHTASGFHRADAPDMAELIYQGFRVSARAKPHSYPHKKNISQKRTTIESVTTLAKPEKNYSLSKIQTDALIYINRVLPAKDQLQGEWTAIQIKKAFRLAAKVCHPDHGGSSVLFMELQQSAKILLDFLQSIK